MKAQQSEVRLRLRLCQKDYYTGLLDYNSKATRAKAVLVATDRLKRFFSS